MPQTWAKIQADDVCAWMFSDSRIRLNQVTVEELLKEEGLFDSDEDIYEFCCGARGDGVGTSNVTEADILTFRHPKLDKYIAEFF
jgi:hypothetical protein